MPSILFCLFIIILFVLVMPIPISFKLTFSTENMDESKFTVRFFGIKFFAGSVIDKTNKTKKKKNRKTILKNIIRCLKILSINVSIKYNSCNFVLNAYISGILNAMLSSINNKLEGKVKYEILTSNQGFVAEAKCNSYIIIAKVVFAFLKRRYNN